MPVSNGDSLIGIIGAGAVGLAVARHAARAGIDVMIAGNEKPDALAALVAPLGSRVSMGRVADAAEPEIVMLTTPWLEAGVVLASIVDWEGRILVDATNPVSAADRTAARLSGATSSEAVARMAVGAHLIKAFNTLPDELLAANPISANGRRVLFLAGDHARAKTGVRRLIEHLGFAAIDLGTLAVGGALIDADGGPLFGQDLVRLEA